MQIDWAKVAIAVEKTAALVEELAPLAAAAGPGGAAIGKMIAQGAAYVSSALEAATEAAAVIATGDLATIHAADALVRVQNIELAREIAKAIG